MAFIFLIGPRGSGKTTIGKMAAEKLNWQFEDLDLCLCQEEGRQIEEIVRAQGWETFRNLESSILQKTTSKYANQNAVIATGGGIVLREENRGHLRNSGTVFWLDVPVEDLRKRLLLDPQTAQRPSLTGKSLQEEIAQVLEERNPLYRACSHHVLNAARDRALVLGDLLTLLNKGI